MTRLCAVGGALLALSACATPFGFGGDEWQGTGDAATETIPDGDVDTNGPLAGAGGPQVLASRTFCADGEPEGLGVIVDGADVWVQHVGFDDECAACATWSVIATADTDAVDVAYTDSDASTCDCDCATQGIEYVMTGFAEGSWSIVAGEHAASFDVP